MSSGKVASLPPPPLPPPPPPEPPDEQASVATARPTKSFQARMRTILSAAVLGIALGVLACDSGPDADSPAWAAEATSQGGAYRIAVRPRDAAAPRGELHDWIVRVERTD